jgi:Bacteriophage Mu, Gp27
MTDSKRRKIERGGRSADIVNGAISAPPDAADGRHATPVSDVAKLPAGLRELVERMLVEGATFEDVYEAVNERGVHVTLQAIQSRYRSDLELQKRRIQFQAERARVLTEALGDPDSSDAQLAYAAMLTGLQSLSRKDGGLTLRDAVKGTMERRNILLKRDLLRMQIAREEEDKRFRKTRLHAEILKLQLTKTKLAQLQRELKRYENSSTLGRVAMEKIQEIYGLLQIPVIPRDIEAAREEPLRTGNE